MKNPLNKRYKRELRNEWPKYLIVFIFLTLTIGYVSGMYVANESMMQAAVEGINTYEREDGHFELNKEADRSLLTDLSKGEPANIEEYVKNEAEKEIREQLKTVGLENSQQAFDQAYEQTKPEIEKSIKKIKDELDLNDHSQAVPISIYKNFFKNTEENFDEKTSTIRVYEKTDAINKACLMEGSFPEKENEIAIDRMHADNIGAKVGDTLTINNKSWTISGLLAYVNYSTLHEKNTDLMFDALRFDVGMVSHEGFERINAPIHYNYAWLYEHAPKDEQQEKEESDNLIKVLVSQAFIHDRTIEEILPAYANQAMRFATDDMRSDLAMANWILIILIMIIAFIFAITISNTIVKEAQTIGTLRASGYSKKELIFHYMWLPILVTLAASVTGNLLGYTVLKDAVVSLYYNSYSLPTYTTLWNWDALINTTLIPFLIMLIVTFAILFILLQKKPLDFLHKDLKAKKNKRALKLPHWKFFRRFRIRIILQNLSSYLVLFFGILFVAIMLAFAIGMPATLRHYQENADSLILSKYQYVLRSPTDQAIDQAEPFQLSSLVYEGKELDEEVSIYGLSSNSKVLSLPDLKDDEVVVSKAFEEKYGIKKGDTLTLKEKYSSKTYSFHVEKVVDEGFNLSVFMPIAQYDQIFDQKDGTFNGYFSDTPLTALEEEEIASIITKRDLTKMADQLDHSMGAMMNYFQVLCVLLAAALIYLLSKLIIEKNENAISLTKIFGYEDQEIAKLYLASTTIVVLLCDCICVFLGLEVVDLVWKEMMLSFSGWFSFYYGTAELVKIFLFILIAYLVVLFVDYRRIKKIPMDQVLKENE